MFNKKQWSEEELTKSLEILNAIVELTMEEYDEYKKTENLGRYFLMLWTMKYRWDQRFVDVYNKLKHVFIAEKSRKIYINEVIKWREIENKKDEFCNKTQTPSKNIIYYILHDTNITDDNILIIGIPYTKFENWENKRKFWGTVEISKIQCPNLYKKIKASHDVFNEDKF